MVNTRREEKGGKKGKAVGGRGRRGETRAGLPPPAQIDRVLCGADRRRSRGKREEEGNLSERKKEEGRGWDRAMGRIAHCSSML